MAQPHIQYKAVSSLGIASGSSSCWAINNDGRYDMIKISQCDDIVLHVYGCSHVPFCVCLSTIGHIQFDLEEWLLLMNVCILNESYNGTH